MPLNKDNSYEYIFNKNPKCPYCDEDIDVHHYELWELYSEECHEINCPECEREIKVQANTSWTFSTDEQDD
jgi:C4-type Zn-finger protein